MFHNFHHLLFTCRNYIVHIYGLNTILVDNTITLRNMKSISKQESTTHVWGVCLWGEGDTQ